jgi:proteasome lid subunit RPN8/RPN11
VSEELNWALPADLLAASIEIMGPHGRLGNEGLALWLGRVEGHRARVTHVVSPRGQGFRASPLQLKLSWNAMARLTDLSDALGTYLVGQIHSHPGLFVDLSEVDEKYGIRCQDYLSVVCPHYAQRPVAGVEDCGVHVFDRGSYRRLGAPEVARRVAMSPSKVELVDLEVPA